MIFIEPEDAEVGFLSSENDADPVLLVVPWRLNSTPEKVGLDAFFGVEDLELVDMVVWRLKEGLL